MADQSKTVELLETSSVKVGAGESFNVQVPAKGATGNVWSVAADPKDVRIVGHIKNPSEVNFGGGGVEVFTLQPMHEGVTEIKFRLGAPWRSEPTETHSLSIDVAPSAKVGG